MSNATTTLLIDPQLKPGENGLSHMRRTVDLNGFQTINELSRFLGVRLDDLTAGKPESLKMYCKATGIDEQQFRKQMPVRGPSGWQVGNHMMSQHGLRLKAPLFCPLCVKGFACEPVPSRWEDNANMRTNLEWYVSSVEVCCKHNIRLVSTGRSYLARETKDTSLLLADIWEFQKSTEFVCEEIEVDAYDLDISKWLNSGTPPHPHLKQLGLEGTALAATAIGMDITQKKRGGRFGLKHPFAKAGYPILCDEAKLKSFVQNAWHTDRSKEDIGVNLRDLVNICRRADFSIMSRDSTSDTSSKLQSAQIAERVDCVGPNEMAKILGFDRVRRDLFVRSNFMEETMESVSATSHNTWVRTELVNMRDIALGKCSIAEPQSDAQLIPAVAKRINRGFLVVLKAVVEGKIRAWRGSKATALMDIMVSVSECREQLLPDQIPGLRGKDISNRLGIPDKFVKLLIDGQFLPSKVIVNPLNAYRTTIVAEADFDRFDDRYIKAAEIARRVGTRAHLLERELAEADILPKITREDSGTAFYERNREDEIRAHLRQPKLKLDK